MSDKVWKVRAIECGMSADDAFDYDVGYVTSLEEAEAACKRLKDENEAAYEFWNKYGCACCVECGCWPSANDPLAIAALEKEHKHNKCPHADLMIKELFYEDKNTSGGFEIVCKNRSKKCYCPTEYDYVIEELERL